MFLLLSPLPWGDDPVTDQTCSVSPFSDPSRAQAVSPRKAGYCDTAAKPSVPCPKGSRCEPTECLRNGPPYKGAHLPHCVKILLLRISSESGKDLSSFSPRIGFSERLKRLHFSRPSVDKTGSHAETFWGKTRHRANELPTRLTPWTLCPTSRFDCSTKRSFGEEMCGT